MPTHIKISKEFLPFVEQFREQTSDKYLITLLNIILENFDDLASCGTSGGKRARLLYDLIQNELENITDPEKRKINTQAENWLELSVEFKNNKDWLKNAQ